MVDAAIELSFMYSGDLCAGHRDPAAAEGLVMASVGVSAASLAIEHK
jgi:hypothetical protein